MDRQSAGQIPLPLCRNCQNMGLLVAAVAGSWVFLLVSRGWSLEGVDWLVLLCVTLSLLIPFRHAWLHYELKAVWAGEEATLPLAPAQALDHIEAVIHSLESRKVACQLYRSDESASCKEGYIECLIVIGAQLYNSVPPQIVKLLADVVLVDQKCESASAGESKTERCRVKVSYRAAVPFWSDRSVDFLPAITGSIFDELEDPRPFWLTDVPQEAQPSGAHRARVQAYYLNLPREIRLLLMRQGARVAPVRRIVDLYPEFQCKMPSGYGDGHTYEHCLALYSSSQRTIVIAEEYKRQDDWLQAEDGHIAQSVEHEVGHALDHALGSGDRYFSSSDEFAAAYEEDKRRLPPDAVQKLKYYLQDGMDGREETFADIFNSVSLSWHDADYIEQAFPRTTRVIQQRLKTIEVELAPNRRFS